MKEVIEILPTIGALLPKAGIVLAAVALLGLLIALALRAWDFWRALKREVVYLEVTPPASADKTPQAAQAFFARLHGLGSRRTFQEKLLRQKVVMALELPSEREHGIRFVLRVGAHEADDVQRAITAHSPGVKIQRRTADYLASWSPSQKTKVIEFKQTAHFAFPLKSQESFTEHDLITYLTEAMGDLAAGEQATLQLIISPAVVAEAAGIASKVFTDDNLLAHVSRRHNTSLVYKGLSGIVALLSAVMGAISEIFHERSSYEARLVQQNARPNPAVQLKRPFEQELAESVHHKVTQPLFRVEARVLIVANDRKTLRQRTKELSGAIALFDVPNYQSLRPRHNFPARIKGKYRLFAFRHRLPSFFRHNSSILSASELAGLYHFPTPGTSSENLVRSLSPTLPATLALKRATDFDVLLGMNVHQGKATPIGMSALERARHTYVVGATGTGKTTLMKYAIIQDIRSGKGLAVLDPHGDVVKELLPYIPEERLKDVIYFNPDDLEYPVRLNMLELDPSLKGDDLERAKYLMTEYTVEIFRKLFSDDDIGGSRIEAVLRNAIYTAFTTKDPTLFTLYQLITDKDYRKKVVAKLDDEVLKNFWNNEFDQGGEFQRVKMGFGVTTKVGRFLTAVFVRRIMDQPKSTIDFDDIINSGKILICNLSKGNLVKDTSALFGTTILARLQIAGQRRGNMPEEDRRPFHIYIDEFQNFATTTFVDMVSEARKFGMHLFMAEQSTSQQDRNVINNILGNVGTVICFGTGNPMDEQLLLPRFAPWVQPGEIINLPSYSFFARIKPVGGGDAQAPVSGQTIKLEKLNNPDLVKRVIKASRANYAKKYEPETRSKDAGDDKKPKGTNDVNPTVEPT